MSDNDKPTNYVRARYSESKKRMANKILAIGYKMGYDRPESPAEERMERWRVNLNHVNRWLKSEKSKVRKTIERMTSKELRDALTQFELVYKDYLKRI